VIYRHNRAYPPFSKGAGLAALVILALVFASCGDKSTNAPGVFDIYGRIVNRPFVAGLSFAEFYIFHSGQAVNDAVIIVKSDTVRHSPSEAGHYYREMNFRIGDTLSYSITSEFGVDSGTVIIPDSISIVSPQAGATLYTGTGFTATWHRGAFLDGYFAYLRHQSGNVMQVRETTTDTTAEFLGQNIIDIGVDTFWVETLKGAFNAETAPNGKILPRGVVGAAGTFRDVFVTFAPPLIEGKRTSNITR
jgi:hypothetical protein